MKHGASETDRPKFSLRTLLISVAVVCLLLTFAFRALPAAIDYLQKAAVAAHQRGVTVSLVAWGEQYSQISSQHDASRAMEMIGYIETYYVPRDGYRADPRTDAALEDQRKRTIEQLTAAVIEWRNRSGR
jgi:hypothetical protein